MVKKISKKKEAEIHNFIYSSNLKALDKIKNLDVISDKKKITPLMIAVYRDKLEIVEYLIKRKVDLDFQNAWGDTALSYAMSNENFEIFKTLVDAGAKIDLKDIDGATELIEASFRGNLKMVKLLLKKGAQVNVVESRWGTNALHGPGQKINEKQKKEFYEIAKLLIENGIKINLKDKKGATPLLWASSRDLDLVKLLRKSGARVKVRDKEGITPLMAACMNNRLDIVKYLLKEGVNINTKNKNKKTALEIAKIEAGIRKDDKLVKFLEKSGAK